MHFVPRAKGDGTRPATLGDAKKLSLFPGVTSVLDRVLRKPALEKWLIQQAVLAVTTAPDVQGEALDAKIVRVLETEGQQKEESKLAMDRGTEIHAALENAIAGREVELSMLSWIKPALAEVRGLGELVATEKIVVGPGFAGKVDLLMRTPTGLLVLDYKTTKKLPDKGAWPEHRLQLAAYGGALTRQGEHVTGVGNVYISTVEPGAYKLCAWPNWQEDYTIFLDVFSVWCWMTGYVPATQDVTTH